MKYPETADDLIKIFGDVSGVGYFQPVPLKDTKVGFSIQKYFPSNIRFKPAKTKNGVDDSVACIWIVYQSELESKNVSLIPIRFRIALMSRYRAKHQFDEDDFDLDKPTQASVEASKKSPQPIDLIFRGEYFYDTHSLGIVDKNGKEIRGAEVLEIIFEAFCDSVHLVKGFRLRCQELAQKASRGFLENSIAACIWLLKNCFGRTLNDRPDRSSYFDGYQGQDLGKLKEDSFEVIGYKVPIRVFVVFAIIVSVSAYSLYPYEKDSYIDLIVNSDVLLTLHLLSVLLFVDVLAPHLVFAILNFLINVRKSYINWLLQRI